MHHSGQGLTGPTISACLIVKNEEQCLPRVLGSLSGAVDEVVVVDTGSTDATVEIARQYGARVSHFDWCDDFSAARNASLQQAVGDWVFWIDADDELRQSYPGALRDLCSRAEPAVAGYWMDIHSAGAEAGTEAVVRHWRLFRNDGGTRFRGRVHEEPWPASPLSEEAIVSQNAVDIHHWGYVDPSGLAGKIGRNIKILQSSLADEPDSALLYYHLGREFNRLEDFSAALEAFDQAARRWNEQGTAWPFAHSLFSGASFAALKLGAYQRVIEIEGQTPGHLISSELLCDAATAYWRLGQPDQAIERFRRAYSDPGASKASLRDPACSTWFPRKNLAELFLQSNNGAAAFAEAVAADELRPGQNEIELLVAASAQAIGQSDLALHTARKVLTSAANPDSQEQARRILLQAGDSLNDMTAVLEALSGAITGVSEADAVLIQAAAHERLGNQSEQVRILNVAADRFPDDLRIQMALVRALGSLPAALHS